MDSVVFLQTHFPEMVEDMQKAQHHYDWENLNPHHLEGDVWSHQMMVSGQVRDREYGRTVNIAALCHDLGKPVCRDVRHDTKRVRFSERGFMTKNAWNWCLGIKTYFRKLTNLIMSIQRR